MQLKDRHRDHWENLSGATCGEDIEVYPTLKYTVKWDEANSSPLASP